MKKTVFSFLFFFMLLSGAKVAVAQSFNGGLIAGATFCQVDGDKYFGYNKLGFTAGGYVNLPIANHFALQMELKYTQMGAKSSIKEAELPTYGQYKLVLHYAEIPLMLRYDFGHFTVYGKSLDFLSLEAGFSLDFLLKYYGEMGSQQFWKFNFFSVSGNFGLHFALSDHWGLGARMMYSITPMQTNPTPQWVFNHAYNKVIQATVTYNINSPVR
ncbi:MAG: PorT family protein [Bacteroidales bacterium]|nr:PorT family protein [Bacteroidales bacterium]